MSNTKHHSPKTSPAAVTRPIKRARRKSRSLSGIHVPADVATQLFGVGKPQDAQREQMPARKARASARRDWNGATEEQNAQARERYRQWAVRKTEQRFAARRSIAELYRLLCGRVITTEFRLEMAVLIATTLMTVEMDQSFADEQQFTRARERACAELHEIATKEFRGFYRALSRARDEDRLGRFERPQARRRLLTRAQERALADQQRRCGAHRRCA